ncbi:MAG: hypothetical protein Q4B23_01580 [Helcococcus sp.]|nr:hypothetical protein [Helcococcus sp.]
MFFFWNNNDRNNRANKDARGNYRQKYKIGQRVMIRWRGQVGDIIDFDRRTGLYSVRTTGPSGFTEAYYEQDLNTKI